MNPKILRIGLIFIPVALVLGIVTSSWLRQAQTPPASSDALLERGSLIDATFTGLVDPQGKPVDESRFKDRYRLVAFGFTSCPDICPTMLAGVHQALEKLGPDAQRLVPVFVSVDPQRDTPERIGEYVAAFDKRILGLSGSPDTLARVAKQYRAYYTKRQVSQELYVIDHTALLYLIDPQQRIRALIPTEAGPQAVATEIVQAFQSVVSKG
jgi:cytochrome oxidase Cu insertion factor (SCO1/SenC/PrrC family)